MASSATPTRSAAVKGATATPEPSDEAGAFVGHAWVVAALTLLSRVAGLARDAVCARLFGAGAVWSSFAAAFLLPNLFRRLFGEGALSAAFIPIYADLRRRDPDAAQRFARATFTLALALLSLATVAGEALLALLLVGTPLGQTGALALRLALVLLPFMPMVCATALLGGALQSHGVFGPTAAAPIILNLCIIVAALVSAVALRLSPESAIFAVALSVLAAGAMQLAWSARALRRSAGISLAPASARVTGEPLRRLARSAGPAIVGLGVFQLNTLLDGLIASWPVLAGPRIVLPGAGAVAYPLDDASNAVLFYANRLYQFPLGVFGVSLATAAFPALSRLAHREEAFGATLQRGVRLALFLGVPAGVGLALVRQPLAGTIFAGGRFDAAALSRVADVVLGYAPALLAAMIAQTLTRAFYAQGDTRTPMRIALAAVAGNLALNLALIWPLREAGLAWATSASTIMQAALLALLLPRAPRALALGRGAGRTALLAGAGSALMAPAVLAAMRVAGAAASASDGDGGWPRQAAALTAGVVIGAGVFGGFALLTRMEEVGWLLRRSASAPAQKG